MKMKSAKILLLLILSFGFFFGFTHKTLAFSSGENFGYQLNYWKAIDSSEMNLQSFVNETFKGIGGSIVNLAIGCQICDSKGKPRNFGFLGDASGIISATYTALPSSSEYIADIGQRLNLITPTYAQNNGTGFDRLDPFLNAWKAFRNISYALLAIIMVFIGFAIMFRVKLSPQASVTLQTAVPQIIIVLVLITFSYAIVGFLVDIMFVLSNLILTIFSGLYPKFYADLFNKFVSFPTTDNLALVIIMLKAGLYALLLPMLLMGFVGIPIGAIGAGMTGGIGVIAGFVPVLLFAIVLLIALIRILIMLVKSFVNVVLSLIFAPFILLAGAIPGMSTVGSWIRNIISNLLIFPVVLTLVSLASFLTWTAVGSLAEIFVNFITGVKQATDLQTAISVWAAATNKTNEVFTMFFIAPGILLMAPKAGEIIQSFISKKPFAYGTAIGEAMGPITGPAKQGWGIAKDAGQTYIKNATYGNWGKRTPARQPESEHEPGGIN
jgi:hypothetical protein